MTINRQLDYEARMDKLFSGGRLYKHRTLRTIFDRPSNEWGHTTIHQKIEILRKIVVSGESLASLVSDYKYRYIEQNRRDIAIEAETALAIILENILKQEE